MSKVRLDRFWRITMFCASLGLLTAGACAAEQTFVLAPTTESAAGGSPVELALQRAGSSNIDLRNLPDRAPRPRARLERSPPEHTPVALAGDIDPQSALASKRQSPLAKAAMPAPLANFIGLDSTNWGTGVPPDSVGDVGPTHYIQAINTSVGIYRKSDGVRLAAFAFDTFMSQGSFGNLCDTENAGHPVVLYDTFEDRWVVADHAFKRDGGGNVLPPGSFQCIAVSKTGDPVSGGWNFYSLPITDGLNDTPKLGIWPDGIYMAANMFPLAAGGAFQGTRVWALNKTQMYAGQANPQVVQFSPPVADFALLPSNARLQTGTPPTGTPNYFSVIWNYYNVISFYKFQVDWNRVSLSNFTGPYLTVAPTSWNNPPATVPSMGGNANDPVGIRLMMQNQYTNIGGVESLWNVHTVDNAATPGVVTAPRYYQVTVTGGTIPLNTSQAAYHEPDANHRYIPSLAVNRVGDMAIGYSASSATLMPAIRYAGRLVGDPVNTLPQTETSLIEGTGAQNQTNLWGGYSAMSLAPDGCTFWYTNEYYITTGINWQTRIGAFAFPSCTPVTSGTLSGTVTATTGGAPISGAVIHFGSRSATTNASGFYQFITVPTGTYPGIAASATGYVGSSAANMAVSNGATTTQNFSLATAAATACPVDTSQADFQTGVLTNVDLTTNAGDVILSTLNQQNSSLSNNAVGISTATWGGQTFTPSVTGPMTRADIHLFCFNCSGTTPNLTLSVRATVAGLPSGADLASTTITGFSNGAPGFYSATFSSPATLTSGTQYALVIRPTLDPSAGTYAWVRSGTASLGADVYPGGVRVAGQSSGATWVIPAPDAVNTTDAGFRVFITASAAAAGNLVSSTKDANPAAGLTPTWTTLSWNASVPANTTLNYQIAASTAATGPFNFVGPDGTAGTFFTSSSAALTQFNGKRYLKYKAALTSSAMPATATVQDVTVCYNNVDCSAPPAITPTPAQVCNSSTGNTASGPAGATTYAWSITNGTVTSASNSQSITFTAGATGNVGLSLSTVDLSCSRSGSINVPIIATPATPTITPGGPTTFCAGGSVTLTSSSASGNQWYLNGNPIGGATNQQYVATASGNYTVIASNGGCSSPPSAATTVTVNPLPPTPTNTPGGPTTFCAGGAVTLTSSSASGNQWYLSGNPIGGATNQAYVATASGNYATVVTFSGCPSAPSAATTVTVNPLPSTPTVTPGGPTTFCTGGSVTLTSSSASGNQWYLDGNPIGGETNSTLIATASGSYSVVVTSSGCSSAASAPVVVTVNSTPPTPTVTPGGPTTFCAGGGVTLTSSSFSGNQWFLNGNPIGGATSQDHVAVASGNYSVVVTAASCSSGASSATGVTVNPLPSASITAPASIITGTAAVASVPGAGAGASYAWTIGNGSINGASNGTSINFTAGAPGPMSLGVTVTDGNTCAAPGSASPTVTAPQADLNITKSDGRDFAVIGSAVTYSITAFNSGPSPAPNSAISDIPPPACSSYSWTCAGAFGGTCTAAGSGPINDTVNLPNAASVTYTANCVIAAGASGVLANSVTVSNSINDPSPGNNTASDSDLLVTEILFKNSFE